LDTPVGLEPHRERSPKLLLLAARGHHDTTVNNREESVPVPLVAFFLVPMLRKK